MNYSYMAMQPPPQSILWHTVNIKDQQMHAKNVNKEQFNFGIFSLFLVLCIS